jgi:hypothetical protein
MIYLWLTCEVKKKKKVGIYQKIRIIPNNGIYQKIWIIPNGVYLTYIQDTVPSSGRVETT